ncbi:MAG: DUF1080 domain-containing protein [Planctomycetia bacterium]|nr:DUF1080 domain-containing protein [Planctomycetia bacterium]
MRKIALPLCTLILLAATALWADDKSVTPFNGKNLEGWTLPQKPRSHWTVGVAALDPADAGKIVLKSDGAGELVNAAGGGVNISTTEKFGDCTIALEFMVPKGANSGVYVQGEYEVQILDSFGKEKVESGDLGGLYSVAAPRVNAAKKPGEWQTLEIQFRAPRFEGDKKTENAKFLKVVLNGQVIHENVEVKGPTPSGLTGKEAATGPLMFQGDHGPVAYRNIRLVPAK